MRWVIGIVALLVMVVGAALFVAPARAPAPSPSPTPASIPDLIEVSSPLQNATITSPLVAQGRARGTWYFEASFPIELRSASGALLVQGYGQAQTNWMTSEFVAFVSIPLIFAPQPKGSVGTLILHKDNPSGLPEHDRKLEVPVVF